MQGVQWWSCLRRAVEDEVVVNLPVLRRSQVRLREAARALRDEGGAVHAVGEGRQHGQREEAEALARQRAHEAEARLPELTRALQIELDGRAGRIDARFC